MTPEGILTESELPFDSALGQKVVRKLRCLENYKLYRAIERQKRIAQANIERRRFGDGACVTMTMDPVLMHRLISDPRFGPDCFGEAEFLKDMRRHAPELCTKTRYERKHFSLGAIPRQPKPDKDAKYLIQGTVRSA